MKHYSFILSNGIAGIVLAENEDAAKRTITNGFQLHMSSGEQLPALVGFQEESPEARVWFVEEANVFREADWATSLNELAAGTPQ